MLAKINRGTSEPAAEVLYIHGSKAMIIENHNKVWVFFYGTFMSARVLREHGIACDQTFPAKLNGYALSIRPRVNLKTKSESAVYGGLALVSHEALSVLYDGLRQNFKIVYNPYAVIAELPDGTMRPTLCFISSDIPDSDPDPSYVHELSECAKEMQAPNDYIKLILGFVHS